jgi:hypothetical protein
MTGVSDDFGRRMERLLKLEWRVVARGIDRMDRTATHDGVRS